MRLTFALVLALSLHGPALAQEAGSKSRYQKPVDKMTYETPGQFKTYYPAAPRDERGQRVTTQDIVLLTGEPDISTRVTVQDLATYMKNAEARAYAELAKNKTAMSAMARFNCRPDKCEVEIASQGQADNATLQALYDVLSKLPPLKTTGAVAFQLVFNVGP